MALDPLARERLTSRKGCWEPTAECGARPATHRLQAVGEQRLAFVPTTGTLFFQGFLVVAGFGCIFWAVLAKIGLAGFAVASWKATGCRLLLGSVGILTLRFGFERIVFEKRSGFSWRGKSRAERDGPGHPKQDERVRLSEVVALQLLSQRLRGREGHELNLVLASGERVYLVDHGNGHAMRADAESLSGFLGVPVLAGDVKYETDPEHAAA